jgi:hypothetical protein
MRKNGTSAALILFFVLITAAGCVQSGKVDQGRVIAYDKETRTLTMIRDKSPEARDMNIDLFFPDYTVLPPVQYRLPDDPTESGPEPKAGLRMKLDLVKKQVIVFDPGSQTLKTIDYALVDQKENVRKDDPLVYDYGSKKARNFPIIDRRKKTITLYSPRQKTLVIFTLPESYFDLPDYTWVAGDEVRIYYKEPGIARRFMNVSKTDIYKK